jgi:UDP-glucose 4-epimerase
MLLRGLAATYGYEFLILRYMNVYGPGQRAGVVPAVANALLDGQRPKLTGDGTQAFDFVHVDDCADANTLALSGETSGEDLNVGSGKAASLNDLVELLAEILDDRLEPLYDGPIGTAPPRVGDVSKAAQLIGFQARIPLRDGLASVLEELRDMRESPRAGLLVDHPQH